MNPADLILHNEFLKLEKIKVVIKTILLQLCIFAGAFVIVWGSQKIYGFIDPVVFPENYISEIKEGKTLADLSEKEKGVILSDSIIAQMQRELDSTFGWTFNDILFNRVLLDNRAYRQYGVYHGTKFLMDTFATQIAKIGSSDRENENLYKARISNFVIDPRSFWFPSAEGSYEKGIELVKKYQKDLMDGKANYNCRTDDIYIAIDTILGENMLGYALGLLENAQDIPFWTLDNRIYEVQGICLVIRDFIWNLYLLYPDVITKSNVNSFKAALDYLDKICNYDPLYVTSWFNSGELVTSWLLFARARLDDVLKNIKM